MLTPLFLCWQVKRRDWLHQTATHPVRLRSQAYQPRAEEKVGAGSERVAASSGNCFGSCKAHHVGVSPRKIAAAQRARWAKVKAAKKAA
jgi:hypothetical protein